MRKDLIPPLPREQYAAVAIERLRRSVRSSNGKVWAHDAWWIIRQALRDESPYVQDVGLCSLMMYEGYVLLAIAYLQSFPNTELHNELSTEIESVLRVLADRVEMLSATKTLSYGEMQYIIDVLTNVRHALARVS